MPQPVEFEIGGGTVLAARSGRVGAAVCGLVGLYGIAVGLILLGIWMTPWGMGVLAPSQLRAMAVAGAVHGAVSVIAFIGWRLMRVRGSGRAALALAILFFPVSLDLLVGIIFPPFPDQPPDFLMHPELGWINHPNHTANVFGARVRFDERGLRADEDGAASRPAEADSILFVGDSLCMGWGVRYRETFGVVAADILNRGGAQRRTVEPLLGGVIGYDTRQEAEWLRLFGVALEPRLVVLQFCLNDVFLPYDPAESWEYRFNGNYFRPSGIVAWSGIGRAAWMWVRMPHGGTGLVTEGERLERFSIEECLRQVEPERVVKAWGHVMESLDRIDVICRRASIPLVLMVFPVQDQLRETNLSTHPQERMGRWAGEHGVAFVDMLKVYRGREAGSAMPAKDFFLDLTHPSPRGHALAGKALVEEIERRGLLGRGR